MFLTTFVGSGSETDDLSGKIPMKVIASPVDSSQNAELFINLRSREDWWRRTGFGAPNLTNLTVKELFVTAKRQWCHQRWFAAAEDVINGLPKYAGGCDRCDSTS
jgi:hypothetical protein